MPVTIRDIARELNLSPATVSKSLTGRNCHDIQRETQERVRLAARRMGYRPNEMARSLRSGRTHLISLLVHRVHPAFYSRFIDAFQKAIEGSGFVLQVHQTWNWTAEQWSHAVAGQWTADGLVIQGGLDMAAPYIGTSQSGMPIVNVGDDILTHDGPAPLHVDQVNIDLSSSTSAAVRYLLAAGRNQLAFLGSTVSQSTSRATAFTETMQQAGRSAVFVSSEFRADEVPSTRVLARQAVRDFLEAGGAADALVCFNDEFAVGALSALAEKGLRVPEDVAIVGCDDIEETQFHIPTLSTQHFPFEEATRQAWAMLRRRIENPDLPRQYTVLPSTLVVRESLPPTEKEENAGGSGGQTVTALSSTAISVCIAAGG